MSRPETPLEMAQRHVTEGEARVARQPNLIAELDAKGFDTARAFELLALLKEALDLMYQDLACQQERAVRHGPKQQPMAVRSVISA